MATNAKNLAELLNTDTTVAATDVADNSISAAKLDIVGNGTSGQFLKTDGDGSFSYINAPTVAGMIIPFAGSSAPTGFLLCGGQAVSRNTYATLFGIIGTTYGVGDGSSTFNLPDLQGRVIAGKDDMSGSSANRLTDQAGGLNGDTLGDTGGSETQGLSIAQLPSHSHGSVVTNVSTSPKTNTGDGGDTVVASISQSKSATSVGDGTAHNNVQPTIILNYIIKT